MDQLSDEELLINISEGNRAAFEILIKRHLDKFYGLAFRQVLGKEIAEDIVQDAFLKLWERPEMFDANKGVKFTTWFYRLVVNLCHDLHRKKKAIPLIDLEFIKDNALSQDQVVINKEKTYLLENAILNLPKNQRLAINLCFYNDVSNKDAAEIMGLNIKALQSLLIRAKEKLKNNIKLYEENNKRMGTSNG